MLIRVAQSHPTISEPSRQVDRREFLRSLAASAAVAGIAACARPAVSAPSPVPLGVLPGMVASARRRGVTFGCGVNAATLRQPDLLDAHARESGLLVPMGQGAWGVNHPEPDRWDLSALDAMWAWATSVGLPMRGVHLVWHQNLPAWFSSVVTPSNAEAHMRAHAEALMTPYKGRLHSWNPVNEAIFPNDGRPDGLRDSPWLQLLGPAYIPMAFRIAADVDPSAVLVYNDFGLEDDTPAADRKRRHALALLSSLRERGVPIHALGMQAHIGVSYRFNADKLHEFLDAVATLGLDVFVTELDVKDQMAPAEIPARDAAVAATYRQFLSMMLAHPSVRTVMVWGLSDRITWLERQAARGDGLPVRPLPLDAQLQRKPAWDAIVDALEHR